MLWKCNTYAKKAPKAHASFDVVDYYGGCKVVVLKVPSLFSHQLLYEIYKHPDS